MKTPHSTLSLEIYPCQEDLNKYKDQDQEPSHISRFYTIPNKIIEDHEKNTLSMLSENLC